MGTHSVQPTFQCVAVYRVEVCQTGFDKWQEFIQVNKSTACVEQSMWHHQEIALNMARMHPCGMFMCHTHGQEKGSGTEDNERELKHKLDVVGV